jgi:hypothetical protein
MNYTLDFNKSETKEDLNDSIKALADFLEEFIKPEKTN